MEAGIKALGGTVTTDAAPKGRRRRTTTGASASAGPAVPRRTRSRSNGNAGADDPALIEKLKVISADESLTPIQKAQASRKARAAFKRGESAPASAPGAVLGEAAAG